MGRFMVDDHSNSKYKDKQSFSIREVWRSFYRDNAELCKQYKITEKLFIPLVKDFNIAIIEKIVKEGYIFNMGHGLGYLHFNIAKMNYKYLKLDWKLTQENGYHVFHLNEATGGKYYGLKWIKGGIKNIMYYKYKNVLYGKKAVKTAIRSGNAHAGSIRRDRYKDYSTLEYLHEAST